MNKKIMRVGGKKIEEESQVGRGEREEGVG